jgi:hypothetical protein
VEAVYERVITHEQYVVSIRNRVAIVALGMLGGEIPFLEGAIELASLRREAAVEEYDADFMVFVTIESETDHLPTDLTKAHWSKEALVKHQAELDAAIIWAKETGTNACKSLVRRFHA